MWEVVVMKSAVSEDAICISGMGMVTSLGYDAAMACAAARAGIVRAEELDYFRFRSAEDGEVESVIGHPIPELTRGFEGFARLLRIAQAGLVDLRRQVPNVTWSSARGGFYLSLADPHRVYTGLDLIPDDDVRQGRTEEAQEAKENRLDDKIGLRLLESEARLNACHGELPLQFITTTGHTGVAEALNNAIEDLHAARVEMAIVGGVDTLLEEDTLQWLQLTRRLKTSGVPSGLQPGEAGAFLLLETLGNARAREARPFVVLQDVRLGEESRTLLSSTPPTGDGLTEVLTRIVNPADCDEAMPAWLLTDQNGESYRAMEWGNVVVRLVAKSRCFAEPVLWYPAASFGDTGAASGAVSLCMAISAFERGYAPSRAATVVSSADGPSRAAVSVIARDVIGWRN